MDLNSFIFNAINTTNRALFVYDKNNEAINNFISKTPIAQLFVIGGKTNLEEVSFNKFKHSVTHLEYTIEEAFLDECLNSLVDLIYIDTTTTTPNNLSMLQNCFDKATTTLILKFNKNCDNSYSSSNYFLSQVKNELTAYHVSEDIGYLVYVP